MAVDDALARALAKQAADRFESCTAFVTAVGGALDGRVAVASGSAPSSTDAVQSVDAASGRVAAADIRRKLVTVVFCDLSRSLALSEEADAESQRAITMGYFAEIRAAVITHGGIVERSAGDTVVAVFGIPTAHEDDALRAVRAAFGIRQRLAALAADRRFEAIPEVRIGVNTGEVATSPAAADEPIAVGNTLNVARRLEERAASRARSCSAN